MWLTVDRVDESGIRVDPVANMSPAVAREDGIWNRVDQVDQMDQNVTKMWSVVARVHKIKIRVDQNFRIMVDQVDQNGIINSAGRNWDQWWPRSPKFDQRLTGRTKLLSGLISWSKCAKGLPVVTKMGSGSTHSTIIAGARGDTNCDQGWPSVPKCDQLCQRRQNWD
jgi:hypothetical protein